MKKENYKIVIINGEDTAYEYAKGYNKAIRVAKRNALKGYDVKIVTHKIIATFKGVK